MKTKRQAIHLLTRRAILLLTAMTVAVLIGLMAGLGPLSGLAGAKPIPCDPQDPACGNTAPKITVGKGTVVVEGGQTATNSGTYSDQNEDDVTITASVGTVTKTGTNKGTWNWSYVAPTSFQNQTVTITASDGVTTTRTTFQLTTYVLRTNGKIAFQSDRSSIYTSAEDIYMVNPDGTGAWTNITASLGEPFVTGETDPAFSSDGTNIAFALGYYYDGFGGWPYTAEINAMDLTSSDGSETLTKVTVAYSYPKVRQPTFSFDGTKVAYTKDNDYLGDIFVRNSDGSGTETNITNSAADEGEPAFSFDRTKVAYTVRSTKGSVSKRIYVKNSDGSGTPTQLTNEGLDHHPTFSPDGKKIAFARDMGSWYGEREIYVMNADGSGKATNITKYSPWTEDHPTFSPDGKKIAFAREQTLNGRNDIYVMNADGSGTPTNITNSPDTEEESPTWGAKADYPRPWVETVTPEDRPQKQPLNTNVTITFSEPMRKDTLNSSNIHVFQEGSENSPINAELTVSDDNKTVTLDPSEDLAEDSLYVIKVKGGPQGVLSSRGQEFDDDHGLAKSDSDSDFYSAFSTVELDNISPHITINSPIDNAQLAAGEVVNAEYSCVDDVSGSGIESCEGTQDGNDVPNGTPIDTTCTLAQCGKEFTVTARDKAGNEATKTHSYFISPSSPDDTGS